MPNTDFAIVRQQLAETLGERAKNLYLAGQLLCSEAVLVVLNKGLGGDLSDDVAIRLASALPVGLGKSGCVCGALSGAALAIGLFLGRCRPGSRDEMEALKAANLMHDRFKERFGATCCRVLTRTVKGSDKEHLEQCARFTGQAAEMAALVILARRPELIAGEDTSRRATKDSWLGSKLRQLTNLVRG